ncbi:Acyloxidase [Pleurostoma richardsiae]|uniref:Acyloxidase n=1 Tax=Pleurostoma richardsiae TaxID=41990 RepID=A0AA38VFS8_9PEZI|nr:Acyloxidase [Pleurostoma richardsiae]
MTFSRSMLSRDLWSISRDRDVRPPAEKIQLHYGRAKAICEASGLTVSDVVHLTSKFWDFHFDLIAARDMTAFIIATIHLNLCVGTIGAFVDNRPDLLPILAKLERFEVCGEFMLTEFGHGLDARNLETTAHMCSDGSFDLHTPTLAAAKAMPPTTPEAGVPRVAVVFARLMIDGDDVGVRPFLVWLNDAVGMRPGVTSRALPIRPGTKPLDHSITSFDHVRLPRGALLGSASPPDNIRSDFLKQIWRVSVGTLSLSIMGVSALKVGSYIAARYSQQRHVEDTSTGKRVPIFSFSTQQEPIIRGLVFSKVLDVYARWTISEFMNRSLDQRVRHGLATVFKALVMRSVKTLDELVHRCGWQGLFNHNQIAELALTIQGNSIAEGDTLVLCIRLASELLLDRYALHAPKEREGLLAKYEHGIFGEAREKLAGMPGGHRSREFDGYILPRCGQLVGALGQRMAYEAAESSGLDHAILEFFEISCITNDLSWYNENAGLTRSKAADRQARALRNVLPLLPQLLDESEVAAYVTAPIINEKNQKTLWHGQLLSL